MPLKHMIQFSSSVSLDISSKYPIFHSFFTQVTITCYFLLPICKYPKTPRISIEPAKRAFVELLVMHLIIYNVSKNKSPYARYDLQSQAGLAKPINIDHNTVQVTSCPLLLPVKVLTTNSVVETFNGSSR